jgi:hypothetical protein
MVVGRSAACCHSFRAVAGSEVARSPIRIVDGIIVTVGNVR